MILRALLVLLAALNLGTALWWAAHRPPPPPAPPTLPPGLMRLQLADELKAATAAAPAPAAAPAAGPRCFRLGPFDDAAAAEAARQRVLPLAVRVTSRAVPASRMRGWRVYLPPFATIAEAEAAAERVAAAGFRDYFVMREGADANAVALGRFGSESAARRHAEALQAAGFAAIAEPLGNPRAAVWLEVEAGARLDPAQAQRTAGAARWQPAACAGAADGAG